MKAFPSRARSRRLPGSGTSKALIFVCVAAAVITALLVTERANTTKPAPAAADVAPQPIEDQRACSLAGVRCDSVQADGRRFDYAIARGAKSTGGLVLVESGGPGVDAYARNDLGAGGLPPALVASIDLLILREPWTRHEVDKRCADAGKSLVAAAVDQTAGPVGLDECAGLAWHKSEYVAALREILRKESRTLTGIIGQSFGALPAMAATEAAPGAWLILNSAVAPASTTGAAVVAERAAALGAALDMSYQRWCVTLSLDCHRHGREVADTAVRTFTNRPVDGRTRPLTAGDAGLAILGAGYDLEANGQWLWRTLSSIPNASGPDLVSLGHFADQIAQRYGDDTTAPSMAAYLAGFCGAYQGWSDPDKTSALALYETLFRTIATYCAGTSSPAGWPSRPHPSWRGKSCVLVNTNDPVSPADWTARWARGLPQTQVKRFSYLGHASLQLAMSRVASACAM